MPGSTISYLWRDTDASKGLSDRCFAAQPHQSIARDAGFPGQLRQPVSGDASAAVAPGAAGRADSRHPHRLRGELLDAAHDSQAGLRPRNQADRESRPGSRWFPSPTTTTSRRPCFCAPCPARGKFRFRWSGARLTAACSPSISACTTCPARARRSGWRRSRSSPPIPAMRA